MSMKKKQTLNVKGHSEFYTVNDKNTCSFSLPKMVNLTVFNVKF